MLSNCVADKGWISAAQVFDLYPMIIFVWKGLENSQKYLYSWTFFINLLQYIYFFHVVAYYRRNVLSSFSCIYSTV